MKVGIRRSGEFIPWEMQRDWYTEMIGASRAIGAQMDGVCFIIIITTIGVDQVYGGGGGGSAGAFWHLLEGNCLR